MSTTSTAPGKATTRQHQIVSQEEWLAAREQLMAKQREFMRQHDALSAEQRALPWVKIEKEYVFDGPNGKITYSRVARGSELFLGIYSILDVMPNGRNENGSFRTLAHRGRPHDMYGKGGMVEATGRYHASGCGCAVHK